MFKLSVISCILGSSFARELTIKATYEVTPKKVGDPIKKEIAKMLFKPEDGEKFIHHSGLLQNVRYIKYDFLNFLNDSLIFVIFLIIF
jgi:hypothetical protein